MLPTKEENVEKGKKSVAVADDLKMSKEQVRELLADANIDSFITALTEELMELKQAQMKAADDALDQECKKYDYVRKIVKERLTALGVPLYNIPLKFSVQILCELPPLNSRS